MLSLQKNAKVVSIDDYEDVPAYDEKALQKAVANQPIAVAIEGGGRDFQLYNSVSFLPFISQNLSSACMLSICINWVRLSFILLIINL